MIIQVYYTCTLKWIYRTNQVNFKLFHARQISLFFCLCCCLSAVNGSTRMIFASCDTYYTFGKYTKIKIQGEHSSIIRPQWDETENWAGVARNWSWGEQEAGFFASCCLLLHLQGYKGLRTRTESIQVIKIKAHQIFILGAISDFS